MNRDELLSTAKSALEAAFGARFRGIQKQSFQEIHVKLDSYILRSTIVAALGGLLFGFDNPALAVDVALSDRSTHL